MQEPMNSIIHQWSHSWYRSRYCPSSIVQDGGDTAINGTVPIYFQAFPNLCHHVGRGINPRGRAVTVCRCARAWVWADKCVHAWVAQGCGQGWGGIGGCMDKSMGKDGVAGGWVC